MSSERYFAPTEDVDGDFECHVCMEPWKMPLQVVPCEHIFCRDCIVSVAKCPTCRAEITAFTLPHKLLMKTTEAIKVKCEHCGDVMTRKESYSHWCAPKIDPNAPRHDVAPTRAPPVAASPLSSGPSDPAMGIVLAPGTGQAAAVPRIDASTITDADLYNVDDTARSDARQKLSRDGQEVGEDYGDGDVAAPATLPGRAGEHFPRRQPTRSKHVVFFNCRLPSRPPAEGTAEALVARIRIVVKEGFASDRAFAILKHLLAGSEQPSLPPRLSSALVCCAVCFESFRRTNHEMPLVLCRVNEIKALAEPLNEEGWKTAAEQCRLAPKCPQCEAIPVGSGVRAPWGAAFSRGRPDLQCVMRKAKCSDEQLRFEGCGHRICTDCVRAYLASNGQDIASDPRPYFRPDPRRPDRYALRCPVCRGGGRPHRSAGWIEVDAYWRAYKHSSTLEHAARARDQIAKDGVCGSCIRDVGPNGRCTSCNRVPCAKCHLAHGHGCIHGFADASAAEAAEPIVVSMFGGDAMRGLERFLRAFTDPACRDCGSALVVRRNCNVAADALRRDPPDAAVSDAVQHACIGLCSQCGTQRCLVCGSRDWATCGHGPAVLALIAATLNEVDGKDHVNIPRAVAAIRAIVLARAFFEHLHWAIAKREDLRAAIQFHGSELSRQLCPVADVVFRDDAEPPAVKADSSNAAEVAGWPAFALDGFAAALELPRSVWRHPAELHARFEACNRLWAAILSPEGDVPLCLDRHPLRFFVTPGFIDTGFSAVAQFASDMLRTNNQW